MFQHIQTTQGPSVPHLICRRTEGTSTTARQLWRFSRSWRQIQNCPLTYIHATVFIRELRRAHTHNSRHIQCLHMSTYFDINEQLMLWLQP